MHHGEVPERAIRGQATPHDALQLIEEGISVLPMPLPVAAKETLHESLLSTAYAPAAQGSCAAGATFIHTGCYQFNRQCQRPSAFVPVATAGLVAYAAWRDESTQTSARCQGSFFLSAPDEAVQAQ